MLFNKINLQSNKKKLQIYSIVLISILLIFSLGFSFIHFKSKITGNSIYDTVANELNVNESSSSISSNNDVFDNIHDNSFSSNSTGTNINSASENAGSVASSLDNQDQNTPSQDPTNELSMKRPPTNYWNLEEYEQNKQKYISSLYKGTIFNYSFSTLNSSGKADLSAEQIDGEFLPSPRISVSYGGIYSKTQGVSGKSAYFNGKNSYFKVENIPLSSSSSFSISLWFKKTDYLLNKNIIFQLFGNTLNLVTNGPELINQWTSNTLLSDINLGKIDKDWHNVLISYNGKLAEAYLDGKYVGKIKLKNFVFAGNSFYIGRNSNNDYNPFRGLIDEIRIFNRSLNYNETLAIYDWEKQFLVKNEFYKNDCYTRLILSENLESENIVFSIANISNLFGNYGSLVNSYDDEIVNYTYALFSYDKNGLLLHKYYFEPVYDYYSQVYNNGAIEVVPVNSTKINVETFIDYEKETAKVSLSFDGREQYLQINQIEGGCNENQ